MTCVTYVRQVVSCQTHFSPSAYFEEVLDKDRADGEAACVFVEVDSLGRVVCECSVCALSRRRALQEASPSSSPSSDIEIVAMTEYVLSDFIKANKAIDSFDDVSIFAEAILVFSAFGVFFFLFLFLFFVSERAHSKHVRALEEDEKKKKINKALELGRGQARHDSDTNDISSSPTFIDLLRQKSVHGILPKENTKKKKEKESEQAGNQNGRKSKKREKKKRKKKSDGTSTNANPNANDNTSANPNPIPNQEADDDETKAKELEEKVVHDDVGPELDALQEYIESFFPRVFSSRPGRERFLTELIFNHLLLDAFLGNDKVSRCLSCYEFVSLVTQGVFLVALVTSLERSVGDGEASCSEMRSEATCIDASSFTYSCTWHMHDMSCTIGDSKSSAFMVTMYMIMLTMLLAVPLRLVHSACFDCIRQGVKSYQSRGGFTKEVGALERRLFVPDAILKKRESVFGSDGMNASADRLIVDDGLQVTITLSEGDAGEVLARQLLEHLKEYMMACRADGECYSTDRRVRGPRRRFDERGLLKANKAFCRAWDLTVVDSASGGPVDTIKGEENESIDVQWNRPELMASILQNTFDVAQASVRDVRSRTRAHVGTD